MAVGKGREEEFTVSRFRILPGYAVLSRPRGGVSL